MLKLFKIRSTSLFIVLILLVLYALNDAWNSGNTGVSDANRGSVYALLIALIVVMNAYILFDHGRRIINPPYVSLMYLLAIWITFENFLVGMGGWVRFVHIFMTIWWITAYSYFNRLLINRPDFISDIRKFFFILMCLYMGITVYSYSNITTIRGSDSFNAVLNYSYFILVFVPLTFLFSKKITNISLMLILAFLILSMKRGPLIIFPLMYLTYLYSSSAIKGERFSFIPRMILFAIILGVGFYMGERLSGGFLGQRFEKEELMEGSNRRDMYELAYNDISSRDFVTLLIGTGSGSSFELVGSGIHNEWLEFLFTFGIIGVVLYFIFGVTILNRYRKYLRIRSPFAPVMGTLTVFFWTVGMFSGFYFTHSSFYFFSCLGVIEALENNRRLKSQVNGTGL